MRTTVRRKGGSGTSGPRRMAWAVVALALLLGLTAGAPATRAADDLTNLVVNGSFERPVLADGQFVEVPSIEGWTPDDSGAPIEVQRRANGTPGEGDQLVELDSDFSGGIQQSVKTTPGRRYFLSFLASPRPRSAAPQNRLEVFWDGKPVDAPFELGAGGRDTDWTPIYQIVEATKAETTLRFRDAGTPSDSLGTYLDDVSVTELPEQATAQSEGIPGFEVVTAESPDDGDADKEASAECPPGKVAIGGGAQVLGNIGHVFLKASERENDTRWAVRAGALGPNPWRVRAQAFCVPRSVVSSSELEVVTAESAENPDVNKVVSVSASCPPGKWAIAGGARVVAKVSRVFLQRSERDRDNRWTAQADALGEEGPWRLRAQAICVARSVAQSSGLQVVAADSADNNAADKPISVACPPGKTAVAGGGHVRGNIGGVFLQWILREGDNRWASLAESVDDPAMAPWRVRAQAVCLSTLAVQPPVAVDDSFPVVEDLPLPQAAPGILGNDTDPGGDALSALLATGPAHGSVKLRPDGGFTYTPAADYNGPDAFTYKAQNTSGLTSDIATVSLTVSGINDSPRAVNDVAATPAGIPVTVAVTANDTDVDGDALTAKLGTAPASGKAACSGASCTYTPDAGFTGKDAFTYTADDGHGGTSGARVAVTVAPPGTPVAVDDTAVTTEGTAVALPVLANDVPGDPPTTVAATPPSQGTLVLGQDNVFTFTPNPGVQGEVEIPYTITDGDGQTSSARVRIQVNSRAAAEALAPPGGGQGPGSTTTTTPTGTTSAGEATTTTTSNVAAAANNPPGGENKQRSLFARSVAPPSEVRLDLKTVAAHAAVAVLLIILIGFPADLFNKAVEENYDQIRERFRRIPGARLLSTSSSKVSFAIFLVVGTLLYGLLSPGFGFNRASWIMIVGLFVAIAVSTMAFEFPIAVYTRRVVREQVFLRSYPATTVVAVVCVLVSRLAHFNPGYCYGLIGGYALREGRQLSKTDDGRSAAIASVSLLAVSVLFWLAWTPLASAARTSTSTGVLLADSVLSTTFVMGVEGLLFALIPLDFMEGSKLVRWRRPLWLLFYGLVVFAFIHTVLDPRAEYLRPTARGALAGVLFLFFAFGALSILFWAYIRRLSRAENPVQAAK
jgi:hypothetical protein